jgi:hypothetical protein
MDGNIRTFSSEYMTIGFGGEENLDEPMEAWLSISSYQNRVNLLIIFFSV